MVASRIVLRLRNFYSSFISITTHDEGGTRSSISPYKPVLEVCNPKKTLKMNCIQNGLAFLVFRWKLSTNLLITHSVLLPNKKIIPPFSHAELKGVVGCLLGPLSLILDFRFLVLSLSFISHAFYLYLSTYLYFIWASVYFVGFSVFFHLCILSLWFILSSCYL